MGARKKVRQVACTFNKDVSKINNRENKDYYDLLVAIVMMNCKDYISLVSRTTGGGKAERDEEQCDMIEELEMFFYKWPFWEYLCLDGVTILKHIKKNLAY